MALHYVFTAICYSTTWMSKFGEVSFSEGELDDWTNSTAQCPFNTTNGITKKKSTHDILFTDFDIEVTSAMNVKHNLNH